MSFHGRAPAPAPARPLMPMSKTCIACRRVGTRLESRVIEGIWERLCVDPVDCQRHWPVEDRPRWAR